jgi:Putative MetA-pathway of phenol degradation
MWQRVFFVLSFVLPGFTLAQSLDPRAYSNLPLGLNVLLAGYAHSQGEVAIEGLPLQDGRTRVHVLPVGYVRSLDVFGSSGNVAVLLPLVDLTATGSLNGVTEARREVSGLADPTLRLAVNFYGAPALRPKEFGLWRQDLIVGASVAITAPLGQYDEERLINIGSNRWSIKPELGMSQAFGQWTIELATGVTWFTRNDEFFNGNVRRQDPIYSAQMHLTRQLGPGRWGAFSATYYDGGRNSINGVERDQKLGGTRLGLTVSLPVDRQNSIRLSAHGGLYARTGSDFKGLGAIWQHLWADR